MLSLFRNFNANQGLLVLGLLFENTIMYLKTDRSI